MQKVTSLTPSRQTSNPCNCEVLLRLFHGKFLCQTLCQNIHRKLLFFNGNFAPQMHLKCTREQGLQLPWIYSLSVHRCGGAFLFELSVIQSELVSFFCSLFLFSVLQDDPLYSHYQCLHCELTPLEVGSREFSMVRCPLIITSINLELPMKRCHCYHDHTRHECRPVLGQKMFQ